VSSGTLLLQFALCAALIGRAGYVLSRSADRLAQHHGWGRGWVGLAMLVTVTSLPELATGVSAVAWVDAPNLAVGDALGSCVFNLVFLVVIDALQRHQPMYRDAGAAHVLTAAFGVVMLGLVAMSLLLAGHAPRLFHLGIYSPFMLALYLLALVSVNRYEQALGPGAIVAKEDGIDPLREWRAFALAAVTVVAAGVWLPQVAAGLAQATGLSRSFVGTLGLAFATSLPEIAVSLAALRLRALDLAIANLLGSNLFNIVVLAIDDLAYLRGPLLADAAPVHAATAVTAMTMTGLVLIGLVMRPQGRVLRVTSWISIGLVAAYLINAALLYLSEG
jgi:cation:H+ antiporter